MIITTTQPPGLLRSAACPAPQPRGGDHFQPTLHTWQDQLKGAAAVIGTAALGLGLGVYAGLETGFAAGLAGALAGAAGGATIGCQFGGHKLAVGAVVGGLAGAVLAASFGHPLLAAVLGISGATLPYAMLMSAF